MSRRPDVLIVDDSLTVRMDLAEAFEEAGFSVRGADSLQAARRELAERKPEAVILDVRLPDGDGVDFLRELRQRYAAGLAILMLSSAAEINSRLRGLNAGADEYVGKPYDQVYVVNRTRELVGGPEDASESAENLVLVIDDSLTFRETLRCVLQKAGYRVVTAETGEGGLELAARHRPSALLVDGHLPGIDGATVIRRIRLDAQLRSLPCILLTGSEEREDEVRTLEAGADAFVRKSEDLRGILARLASVCRQSSAHAQSAAATLVGPKRILVVDADSAFRDLLSDSLAGESFDLALARSAADALDFLAVQPADGILIDSGLPGGLELCRQIKSTQGLGEVPVLMLIRPEARQSAVECLDAGADDTLDRSSSAAVLRARLRAQMRRKQFEDEKRARQAERMERELHEALAHARARMIEELELKNKELETFSYSVSHDLRAPLRAIAGFSKALAEDYGEVLDGAGQDYLQRVRKAADQMNRLIEDLLRLSRLNRDVLRLQDCDVSSMAAAVLERWQAQHPERKAELRIEPDIHVRADCGLLNALLENLLSNAWKFTSTRTQTVIEVGQSVDGALFVRDNGVGFAVKPGDRMFAPFQRFHDAKEFEGTGIGLATVQRIVARHHGRVWADSVPGEGTTFWFTLEPSEL